VLLLAIFFFWIAPTIGYCTSRALHKQREIAKFCFEKTNTKGKILSSRTFSNIHNGGHIIHTGVKKNVLPWWGTSIPISRMNITPLGDGIKSSALLLALSIFKD